MEQQMFQPGEDGKYRWQYELDMKNNKSILWTVLRILILCMAGLLAGAILLAGNLFGATLIGRDFFLAAAGIAAAPLAIGILSALYAKTEALIPQQAEK